MTDDVPVYVDFRKWPDLPHWQYLIYPLGEDEHGRWFCLPARSVVQRRPEPPIRHVRTSAVLFPHDQWWKASFHPPDAPLQLYVDIASPPEWHGDTVTMFDLDLDVIRDRQGRVQLVDEDEFEEHSRTRNYPDWIIEGARRAADDVLRAVTERREPFDRIAAEWLRRACARSWPVDEDWIERRSRPQRR